MPSLGRADNEFCDKASTRINGKSMLKKVVGPQGQKKADVVAWLAFPFFCAFSAHGWCWEWGAFRAYFKGEDVRRGPWGFRGAE